VSKGAQSVAVASEKIEMEMEEESWRFFFHFLLLDKVSVREATSWGGEGMQLMKYFIPQKCFLESGDHFFEAKCSKFNPTTSLFTRSHNIHLLPPPPPMFSEESNFNCRKWARFLYDEQRRNRVIIWAVDWVPELSGEKWAENWIPPAGNGVWVCESLRWYNAIIEWQMKFIFLSSNGNDVISPALSLV
jgi:hypothetical protein